MAAGSKARHDGGEGGLPPEVAAIVARAKRELEHMIDVNPQAMLLVDQDGAIRRANRALLALLGGKAFNDVLNHSVESIFPARDKSVFSRLLSGEGDGEGLETSVVLPGGASHILRFCLLGMGTRSDIRVLIVDDVTESSISEATARKAIKKEAIEALVGALMHTLNQPLTVISVRTRLLMLELKKDRRIDRTAFGSALQEIADCSMQVAEVLRKAQKPRDYVTETYVEGLEILDLSDQAE